ncbi:MAG: hypothetical protein J0M34_07410 [Alphaproteobacteria bacterium]|nr:hypothetical protein [Alphaproteobacteria bacterium]
MQPTEYHLKPELKARLETALQHASDAIRYQEWNYPLVNKMAVIKGSKTVCEALEAALGTENPNAVPDYARFGLSAPTDEEQEQASDFLSMIEVIANDGQGALVIKGLPEDKRLSLLTMALPYFFGTLTNTARTGEQTDAEGYPRYLKADKIAVSGKRLRHHAAQPLHIDGEYKKGNDATGFLYKPNYMLRFLASRGKGDANLSTNIFTIDEFVDHVTTSIMADESCSRFLTEQCGEAPTHDAVRELIIDTLCKPIWPAPTIDIVHGDVKGSRAQPMLLKDSQNQLFVNHFANVLEKLAVREKGTVWDRWQAFVVKEHSPQACHFFDRLAHAMQEARTEMKTVDGLVLDNGEMLVYNDRRVIHGTGKLGEDVKGKHTRTIVNGSAHRNFDPSETSGSLTPR